MLIRLAGSVMLIRLVQELNALIPIEVTLEGMVTVPRLKQL